MVLTKRLLLRIGFGLEVILFLGLYLFGSRGMSSLFKISKENTELAFQINELKTEVEFLEQKVADWQSSSFYQEKVARETLHMAKQGEEVYFVG
jgi:cell division protein FtsB